MPGGEAMLSRDEMLWFHAFCISTGTILVVSEEMYTARSAWSPFHGSSFSAKVGDGGMMQGLGQTSRLPGDAEGGTVREILCSSSFLPGPRKHCGTNHYRMASWPGDTGATRKALPCLQSHRDHDSAIRTLLALVLPRPRQFCPPSGGRTSCPGVGALVPTRSCLSLQDLTGGSSDEHNPFVILFLCL